jgi:hypothetical protein
MEDAEAMAAAISLLDDDAVRGDYAARAARRAADFGHEAVTRAYLELIARVRGSWPAPA